VSKIVHYSIFIYVIVRVVVNEQRSATNREHVCLHTHYYTNKNTVRSFEREWVIYFSLIYACRLRVKTNNDIFFVSFKKSPPPDIKRMRPRALAHNHTYCMRVWLKLEFLYLPFTTILLTHTHTLTHTHKRVSLFRISHFGQKLGALLRIKSGHYWESTWSFSRIITVIFENQHGHWPELTWSLNRITRYSVNI